MSRIRITRVVTAAAILLPALMGLPPARAEAPAIATIGAGESAFWDGPFIEKAGGGTRAADPLVCEGAAGSMHWCAGPGLARYGTAVAAGVASQACELPSCIDYFVDVLEQGARLRIALDHPDLRDSFGMAVFNPAGELVASDGALYSMESMIDDPAAGRWRIRVSINDVERSGFRMRAALEPAVAAPDTPAELLPNLKATPPFDLDFGGCQATEIAQYHPVRCLRLAAGPANTGDGPLDLRIPWVDGCFLWTCIVETTGVNWQWIHNSDGSFRVRPAGTFEWHAAHSHYHHSATADYRLYRVLDEQTGDLAPAGQGPKVGFCMGDYLIADWHSFDQDRRGAGTGRCFGVDAPVGTRMGLTKGWGDVYGNYIEGNYVDFGDNPDGLYVVRVATDPADTILELDENDNHGYSYFRVTGNTIEVLERGYGMSPWDPNRVIATDGRHPAVAA